MTIVFICGSLEPGKDGVGDYTRRLAAELINQGHHCAIVALMDKFINQPFEEKQIVDNNTLSIFRLPFIIGFKKNSNTAKSWIDDFQPDWVSLQYVPFAFNNKGLPFGLGKALKNLLAPYKLHIMFHEMWMGISIISPFKHKVIGRLQQYIVHDIVVKCNTEFMTTTNPLYQAVLAKASITTEILPLFSSINKYPLDTDKVDIALWLLNVLPQYRSTFRIVTIFGSLYPEAELEKALEYQLDIAIAKGQKLLFVSIGRIGIEGQKEFNRLTVLYKERFDCVLIGEVDDEKASILLQLMDVAISCTPAQHIGKSSVYALLKLHNLPVVMPNKEMIPECNDHFF
jgi:hypothetical protein